jgi:protein involved in polysaccharide export with SLBB domain
VRSLLLSLIAVVVATTGCASSRELAVADLGLQGNADAPVIPGDRVEVRIWTAPDMSNTFVIDENGKVVLPTLGPVQAAGIPAGRLQDSIRTAYAEVVRDPAVRVSVQRRISVMGEVARPGVYMADLTMVVSDVIAQAGGLTGGADPGKIMVYRDGVEYQISQRDRSEYTLAGLRSGDQILVRPRSFWARNPAVVVSTIGSTVSLLAILAGYLSRL